MGAIASVERAELGEVELDVVVLADRRRVRAGRAARRRDALHWYRLDHDACGAEPSGRHRAILSHKERGRTRRCERRSR
jgi:hypothetical protein